MSSPSSSDAVAHLNDTHRAQVVQYLKFFEAKREENTKEIEAVFDEQKDMRLLEEMYRVDDVGVMLDEVKGLVKGQVREEFQKLTQQSVLYIRQLLLQAEGSGVALSVDLSTLDDAVLLSGIDKLSVDAASKKGGVMGGDLPDMRRGGSLAPVANANAVDIKLVTQVKDLQDANRSLLAKFEKLQQQCSTASREVSELREKNEDLQKQSSTAKSDLDNLKSNNQSKQQQEIEALRAQLQQLTSAKESEVASLKAEIKAGSDTLNSKVNNAPQYQQLKKLMNTKNDQLKEARQRIKTLEEHLGTSGK